MQNYINSHFVLCNWVVVMNDLDKTIAPRSHSSDADMETMPNKRVRKSAGKFQPGDLIMQRYKVLAELGHGGMGVVYKCFDEVTGIEAALKTLPFGQSHDQEAMAAVKEK